MVTLNSCPHENTKALYTHSLCERCGAVFTDSHKSWGIAERQWFRSLAHAEFYRDHGRHPAPPREPDIAELKAALKQIANDPNLRTLGEARAIANVALRSSAAA